MKAFILAYFASYLRLGELDLAGLCYLCRDADVGENPLKGSSLNVGPSANPPGN